MSDADTIVYQEEEEQQYGQEPVLPLVATASTSLLSQRINPNTGYGYEYEAMKSFHFLKDFSEETVQAAIGKSLTQVRFNKHLSFNQKYFVLFLGLHYKISFTIYILSVMTYQYQCNS